MSVLNRDAVFNAKPAAELYPVPEWGGDVYLIPLNTKQRTHIQQLAAQATKDNNESAPLMKAMGVIYAVGNEDLSPMFTEADAQALQDGRFGKALDHIFERVVKNNGMTKESAEAAAKN